MKNTVSIQNSPVQKSSNQIVIGTHSKFLFVCANTHPDAGFVNLISLDDKVPNRVERRTTVTAGHEYKRFDTPVTIQN